MIETPLAILNLQDIASSSKKPGARLACFVLGLNDLVKETRADLSDNRRPALYWLSAALTAARAYGLDVLDGQDGSPDKRGYLVAAYSSVVIDGFRRSAEEVAAFRFGDVAGSYAASKGKARNVGVIGFAAFAERQSQAYEPRYRKRDLAVDTYLRESADPYPGRYAQPPVR